MDRTGTINGCKDVSIFWQSWQIADPRAAVVISHGLGEHGGRYHEFAESLNELGYSVFAVDHRGHGRSGGKRAAIGRFQYCIDDLGQLIDMVKNDLNKPVILFGHSMGGAIAVGYTLTHQDKLAGMVLSGAALSSDLVPGAIKLVCAVLGKLVPGLPALKIDPSQVSRDPATVAGYSDDPLNHHKNVPIGTIAEMVGTIARLEKHFAELTLPLLIMHGSDDHLIPMRASEALYQRCGSEDKTLKIYSGLYHEILNELPKDRQEVISDASSWLTGRFS